MTSYATFQWNTRESKGKRSGTQKQARIEGCISHLLQTQVLFGPCKVIARAVQSEKSTALEALERVNVWQKQIKKLKNSGKVHKSLDKLAISRSRLSAK